MKVTVAAKPIHEQLATHGRNIFSRNAFEMIVADDSYALVTVCRARQVDLVLLPHTFGHITGTAICKSLRSLPAPPLTLVFVDDTPQAKELQGVADDVVIGAFDATSLMAKCARLLGVSQREDVRIMVRLRVEASLVNETHMLLGTIVDISVSGMLVETSSQVAAGDAMSAEFYLPGSTQPVALMVKVARLDDRDPTTRRLGLQFLRAQDDVIARIRQFVQTRAKG